jgi:hypothetical protein
MGYLLMFAQAQRSPQTNPSNYSISGQVSGQQTAPSGSVTGDEQKGYPGVHTIPMRQAIASTRPPQFRPSSSGQMRSNTLSFLICKHFEAVSFYMIGDIEVGLF